MTVTLYSWTPPTTQTSKYLLRATPLNGPRVDPLDVPVQGDETEEIEPGVTDDDRAAQVLDDIDDWYSQTIEDDGFLERLDRSAEAVRFP